MTDLGDNGDDQEQKESYFYWDGSDLYEYYNTVNRCGYDNVRIEIHQVEGEDGPELWHDVINKETGELLGHYNFSHSCPGSPGCVGG